MIQQFFLLAGSLLLLFLLQLFNNLRSKVQSIGNLPGYRVIISPATFIGNVLPAMRGISAGRGHFWSAKHNDFANFGCDAYSYVTAYPSPRTAIAIADAEVIKEITQNRARWPKPVEQYSLLRLWGDNIVATEGDEWKKHRKVANPAFSEPNNRMVWAESVRIMQDLFDNVWKDEEEIIVDHAVDITFAITLLIIGSAGFGRRITWADDVKVPAGYHMPFKNALHYVSTFILVKGLFPDWLLKLRKSLRLVRDAFDDLPKYMQEMIDLRRNGEVKEERHDLFSLLLDASEAETDSKQMMTNSDLIGNIFVFLLAGHETTAHTMAFALAMLALHQGEQETLYQHIKSVIPDGRIPAYEDLNNFTHVLAVIYETLRMFPPVNNIPKKSSEDTTITVGDLDGGRRVISVPKGCSIMLHTPGLHYNPRYWKDPHEFRPQRFHEDWPRDAFLPFSGGPRSCIGRRFSEVESVAMLAMFVACYKVEIKVEPEYANETLEQRKERILRSRPGVTMTPIRIPLVFKRR